MSAQRCWACAAPWHNPAQFSAASGKLFVVAETAVGETRLRVLNLSL